MKRIPTRTGGKFPTIETLKIVMEQSPNRTLNVGEIRQRVKVLDALADVQGGDSFVIEDEQHAILAKAVEDFPWQQAHADLLRVIDDVIEAANVSTAPLKAVASEEAQPPASKQTKRA